MSELPYSQEAENVLNLFYQADYMVYVEGEDDICFWEIVLNQTTDLKFEIQDVGGCEYLPPYIERVLSRESNILVACDSDLVKFGVGYQDVAGVIRTYGYSIENTFITSKTVLRAIKTLGKMSAKDVSKVNYDGWLRDFNQKVKSLICLDIYNFINQKGISIVGDNADRFMVSQKSYEICEEKIASFIQNLPLEFRSLNLEEVEDLIQPNLPSIDLWLRGHFFFSATLRYVSALLKSLGKKVSVSNESLYSNLMNSFETHFTETHEHYNHYKEQVELIS